MNGSNDTQVLSALCQQELVDWTVVDVEWLGFSDGASFSLAKDGRATNDLDLEHSHWQLIRSSDCEEVTNSRFDAAVFRPHLESLKRRTITQFSVDKDRNLAFRAEFDGELVLKVEACEADLSDAPCACWTLQCSDGHAILVGIEDGVWRRIHATRDPYFDSQHRPL